MANTLSKTTYVAAIDDAKISLLLTDPVGGSATYATSIDVPGVTTLEATPKVKTVEINGDNTLLDTLAFTNDCDVKFDFSLFSFDLASIIWGGAVVDSGSDPNSVHTWNWSFERGPLFKIEGRAVGASDPGADFHLILPRVRVITPPPIGMTFQDVKSMSVAANAYKLRSTGVALTAVYNQTAVAIA